MSFLVCPHCECETPIGYNFCTSCDRQIKCLKPTCNTQLVKGKTFCFACGESVSPANTSSVQPNRYIRKISQKGKHHSEYTEELSFSDHAVTKLAPYVASHILARSPEGHMIPQVEKEVSPRNRPIQVSHYEPEKLLPSSPIEIENSNTAAQYFTLDGEDLRLQVKDFKGKAWADQQRHYVLLYVSAYIALRNSNVPSIEHIKKAAGHEKVSDLANFSKYLKVIERKYILKLEEGLRLNQDGEKEVSRILALMSDEDTPKGFDYLGRNPNHNANRERLGQEDKKIINEWVTTEVEIGEINIGDLRSGRNYLMVALWIITVHLQKVPAVSPLWAYYFLKEKYAAISVTSEAFSKAAKSNSNNRYFLKNTEGLFYLTSVGVKEVESWIDGNKEAEA